MKSLSLPSILFVALSVFCNVSAFSFSEILSKQAERAANTRYVSPTSLGMSTTTENAVDEEKTLYIYNKAREFAFRDDFEHPDDNEYDRHYHPLSDEKAEIEEAKYWLQEIINVQSGCAEGTLSGKDLCENKLEAAELVGRLRRKIEIHEKRVALRTKETGSLVPTIATELISAALLVVVVAFWATLDLGQQHDDIPTMSNYNEFASIVKEKGYLFSMFQNGSPGM